MSGMYPNNQVIEIFGENVQWPGVGPDGKFTNGSFTDPLIKPSFIPAETLNLLLDNMQQVIAEAGLDPNNIEANQLLRAVQALIGSGGSGSEFLAVLLQECLAQYSYCPLDAKVRAQENVDTQAGGLFMLDGVQLYSGDDVLVTVQDDKRRNGLYSARTGPWVRSPGYGAANGQAFDRLYIPILEGTDKGKLYAIKTKRYEIGTTELEFFETAFSSAKLPGKIIIRDRDGNFEGSGSSGETRPGEVMVTAGNVNIFVPAISATLSGFALSPNGAIASYLWSLVSGPNAPTIASPASASTQVTGLIEGNYVFRLTATDSAGQSGSADASVRVAAAQPLSVARETAAAAFDGTHTLIAGGDAGTTVSDAVDAYDQALTRTTPTALSVARKWIWRSAAFDGAHTLIAGGRSANANAVATVDAYDRALTRTTPTALSAARFGAAAAFDGIHTLFAGGWGPSGADASTATVDAYDQTLTRTTPTALSVKRNNTGAAFDGIHTIFGGGGNGSGETVPSAVVDAYDQALTRTTPTALSVARDAAAAAFDGIHTLFAGGSMASGVSAVVDAYDQALTRTTPTALSVARETAAAAFDGTHTLFAGGSMASGVSAVVDAYDQTLTRTTPTALSVARETAAAAFDGIHTLFAGGSMASGVSDAVDIYVA